jgi:single-strand DNA-binding protein
MARRKSTTTASVPETAPTAPAQTEAQVEQPVVVLRGRLTRDPQLRHTATTGKAVSTLRIAVNHPDADTTFHNVIAWGATAEAVDKYLKKGRLIEATGRERPRTWTDRDGNERIEVELSAYRVEFVRSQPANTEAA